MASIAASRRDYRKNGRSETRPGIDFRLQLIRVQDHRPTLILWMIEPHASAHRTGRLDVSAPVSSTADQPRLVRDVGKLVGVQTEIEVEILLDHRVLLLPRIDDSRVAVREANRRSDVRFASSGAARALPDESNESRQFGDRFRDAEATPR